MTLPPLEPREHYIEFRVEQLLANERWFVAVSLAYDNDPHGPASLGEYAKAKATEQAEREWQKRIDDALDMRVSNLELAQ